MLNPVLENRVRIACKRYYAIYDQVLREVRRSTAEEAEEYVSMRLGLSLADTIRFVHWAWLPEDAREN